MERGKGKEIIDARSLIAMLPHHEFDATDQELVMDFLKPKVSGKQLPLNWIRDIDDIKPYTPQQLYDMNKPKREEESYFFTSTTKKYPNGKRPDRAAGNGFWKPSGKKIPIRSKAGGEVIGYKRVLVFYEGKSRNFVKTDWKMHEYKLAEHGTASTSTAPPGDMKLDEWVLCKIYQTKKATKKSEKKNHEDDQEMQVPPNNEELLQNGGTPRNFQQYADNQGMQPGTQWNIQQYGDRTQWNIQQYGASQGMQPGTQWDIQQYGDSQGTAILTGEFSNAQPQYLFPKLPPCVSEMDFSDYFVPGDSYLNGSQDDDMFPDFPYLGQ